MDSKDYLDFLEYIKQLTGIDLLLYKQNQMHRRLESLRNKRGFSTFLSYFEALKKDSVLLGEFLDRITINVSEFFRNPSRWDILKTKILPDLLHNKKELKCWSAACSSGEEPYTLAIILKELNLNIPVTIIASDIDDNIIAQAKRGVYLETALKDFPKELVKKYFTFENGTYRLNEEIKKMVTFKKQNLLSDRFDTGFDLIICRNVTIYFTEDAKEVLYKKFSDSLKENGVLFVGATEQIFNCDKYKFYVTDPFFYAKSSSVPSKNNF